MSEDGDGATRPTITIAGIDYEVVEGGFLTQTVAERICRRFALGESLRAIVEDDGELPSVMAVRLAMRRHDWFRAMWEEACQIRADMLAEEAIEIADDTSGDMYEAPIKGGGTYMAPNMAAVARAKLRIETRKHAMRHLNPKKYAERQMSLEEGIGGLVISWAGGHQIGRVPRKAMQEAARRAVPVTIDGEVVDAEIIPPEKGG